MNPFKNRPFLLFGLIVYTLIVTIGLLYFRFPTDKFTIFCQTKLELLLQDTNCTITELSYKFPLSVQAGEIKIDSKRGKTHTLCTIDQTTIRPKLSSPISHFLVTLEAGGGKHAFSLILQQDKNMFSLDNIQLSNLDLAKVPYFQRTFGRKITGSLSGSGSYSTTWDKGKHTTDGQGSIQIEGGSFGLLFPILSLKKIDLKTFTTELVLKQDRLHLSKAKFQGKELKGEFSGTIALQSPFKRSNFSIKGALEPLPPLLKKSKYAQNMVIQLKKQHNRSTLPFLLQGSMGRPKFKFDS